MKNDVFEQLLDGVVVNGVKKYDWYDVKEALDIDVNDYDFSQNGCEWHSWYFFVNEVNSEIPYIGVMYNDMTGKNDVRFFVYGCRFDSEVTFDEMMKMLTE